MFSSNLFVMGLIAIGVIEKLKVFFDKYLGLTI